MSWTVWTDGSGTTGGPAGIGFYAECDDPELAPHPFIGDLPLRDATNQQAEILAAAYALHEIAELCHGEPQDITIVSDSQYVVLGWNEYPRRRRKTNLTHWERLTRAVERHAEVRFEWTKGHAGTEGNEQADQLAVAARARAKDEAELLALAVEQAEANPWAALIEGDI